MTKETSKLHNNASNPQKANQNLKSYKALNSQQTKESHKSQGKASNPHQQTKEKHKSQDKSSKPHDQQTRKSNKSQKKSSNPQQTKESHKSEDKASTPPQAKEAPRSSYSCPWKGYALGFLPNLTCCDTTLEVSFLPCLFGSPPATGHDLY